MQILVNLSAAGVPIIEVLAMMEILVKEKHHASVSQVHAASDRRIFRASAYSPRCDSGDCRLSHWACLERAIVSGDVFAGANCVLSTPGDVDSFRFSANNGDTYQLVATTPGAVYPQNICLQLYDPSATMIFSGCSNTFAGMESVATDQKLTATGLYTMVVTEALSGTLDYGVSLERLHPVPTDAQELTLGKAVAGQITLADTPAFTFEGLTTGTYRVSATMTSGTYPVNLCFVAHSPEGSTAGAGCTNSFSGALSIQTSFMPAQDGAFLVLIYEEGYNLATDYTMTVSCLTGNCGSGFPPCTLKDKLSYDATTSTLTMNFTIGNSFKATWNAWLTYQDTMVPVFSELQPITVPPVATTKTTTLSQEGTVGILSTLTYPTSGITCSSWALAETGAP
jgi:hypothetical protein